MNIIWGIILIIISGIGYLGQVISTFWPDTAAKLGLTEPEADVDPHFMPTCAAKPIGTQRFFGRCQSPVCCWC